MPLVPTADTAFVVSGVSPHVRRIADPRGSFAYLVIGDARAVLIDTGYGVGDLESVVRAETSLPLTVLLTHGHVDHAFGCGWFDDVRLNPADLPVHAVHSDIAREVAADALSSGELLAPDADPASFGSLADGDLFDLGGVSVEAHAAPGHTPGSIAFLVVEDRLLMTGDAANQWTFLFLPESGTVEGYRRSLRTLRQRVEGRYDGVLTSHGPGDAPASLLEDLIALTDRILDRTDDAVPHEFQGMRGLIARDVPDGIDHDANIIYDPTRLRS